MGRAAEGAAPPVAVHLERIAAGLDRPLFVTTAGDGSGRIFIVEQGGKILIHRDGRVLGRPFIDLGGELDTSRGERGLLGLAFADDYEQSGLLFVAYTAERQVRVGRMRRSLADPEVADPDSLEVVLAMADPAGNHNGGMLAIGPDGHLWIGTGDGGSAGDPWNNAQSLDSLLGKILRIDVREDPYRIPPDNPFAGRSGARPEIWAYGLRNPWRFSVDRATGDLWIGDVGQNAWEEIDFEPRVAGGGRNYGWRRLEGSRCYRPRSGCSAEDTVLPVYEYGHGKGCSVTGGYVYRGRALTGLVGWYLFGDYCRGTIWALRQVAAGGVEVAVLAESGLAISSFGELAGGELAVCDHRGGAVWRIAPQPEGGGP